MKRTVSLLLTVVMVFTIFTTIPVFAFAASEGDLGTGVYWSYDSETKTLYLSGEGEMPFYDTQRDIPWWNYRNEIKNVVIGEGVTRVASLGKLTQLKEISLPDSVTEIEGSAFNGCYSLETVNLSKYITYVSNRAFDGCESLKNFTINGDSNGKGYPFTDSAGNITGDGYFVCDGVLFANYNTYVDNNLSVKEIKHNTLVKYPSGRQETSYTIPSNTMEIGSDAFSSVKNLQTVTIPSFVISLYVRSFVGYGERFEKPLTLIFQHDTYPTDASYSAIRNLVAGSKVVVKNEEVKKAFVEKSSYFIYNSGGAQNVTIVADPNPTTNLAITSAPKSLIVGETGVVEALQTPYNTTDNITFTSSDESIASFDKYICGQITAHKPGTATIIVTSGSVSKTFTVTVTCEHPSSHLVNVKEATCTQEGYTGDIVCDKCSSIITKGTVIPASGHQYGEWRVIIQASCERDGARRRQCSACPHMQTEVIPATGHTEVKIPAVAPTCTTGGKTEGIYCLACNTVIVAQTTIPAKGHTPVKDEAVPATCTTAGKTEGSHCSVCNAVIKAQTSVPATGHTPSDWIIDSEATISVPGSKHKECTVCKSVLATAEIPQLKPATPKVATTNEIDGINITWNAVEGAVKYNIYRRQGGSSAWTLVGSTTGTSLTDTKVTSGVYYCYSVRAYNSAGLYSDYVSTNTNTRKYMAVPKLTGISNATNGLYIKWNAVPGITNGYRVYRRGAGSTYWTYLGTVKTTYYTDSHVKTKSGEYFRYTVIADGGYYSTFDTTGLYLKRLANPTLTSAVSSTAGITVKWGAVKGTTGYYVYRKTANSGWVRIAAVGGTNNTTYLDKTAQKGVNYTYTVRAVYGATTSAYNSGVSCYDKY